MTIAPGTAWAGSGHGERGKAVELEAVRAGGTGAAVVLLHAVGLDGPGWAPLAALLAERHLVIAPSLRGHGTSAAPPAPWTMADLAADVHALLLGSGLAPAHVVGLSLGGMVAQQLALDHPQDVRSLVLVATSAGFDEPARAVLRGRGRRALSGGMEAVVDETLARWFAPSARAGPVAAGVRRRLLSDDPHGWASTWEAMARFDVRQRLGELGHPALVLGGGADGSIPPAVSAALAGSLPHAELHIVPGAGHLAPLEHPDRYGSLIGDFLAAQARDGGAP